MLHRLTFYFGPIVVLGYARVSTIDQDLSIQEAALRGCPLPAATSSALKKCQARPESREELAILLQFMREGDTLVVTIPRNANQKITTDSALQSIVTLFFALGHGCTLCQQSTLQ